MSYVYKSATGSTLNIGSYVVSQTGMYAEEPIPLLDAEIGGMIIRESDLVVEPVVEPVKSPAPSTPEPAAAPVEAEIVKD